jgi:hypothetical protein
VCQECLERTDLELIEHPKFVFGDGGLPSQRHFVFTGQVRRITHCTVRACIVHLHRIGHRTVWPQQHLLLQSDEDKGTWGPSQRYSPLPPLTPLQSDEEKGTWEPSDNLRVQYPLDMEGRWLVSRFFLDNRQQYLCGSK